MGLTVPWSFLAKVSMEQDPPPLTWGIIAEKSSKLPKYSLAYKIGKNFPHTYKVHCMPLIQPTPSCYCPWCHWNTRLPIAVSQAASPRKGSRKARPWEPMEGKCLPSPGPSPTHTPRPGGRSLAQQSPNFIYCICYNLHYIFGAIRLQVKTSLSNNHGQQRNEGSGGDLQHPKAVTSKKISEGHQHMRKLQVSQSPPRTDPL